MKSFIDRFWAKVEIGDPSACWPWKRAVDNHGYGVVGTRSGTYVRASRMALILTTQRDEPLEAAHSCDNPACCNPRHLRWATHAENGRDMTARNRARPPHTPGVKNGRATLSNDDVLTIRREASQGIPNTALADRFGLTPRAIGMIVRRETWRHV